MRGISVFVGVAVAMLVVVGSAQAQSLFQLQRWCSNDNSDESMKACTAIIEWGRPMAPKRLADAYVNRGDDYADRSMPEKAIADYTAAIKRDPTRDDAFAGRGIQYYKSQDYKHALADFDAAIKLNPDVAVDWAWRSRTKGQLGDADGANADEAHALQLNPQVEQDMSDPDTSDED